MSLVSGLIGVTTAIAIVVLLIRRDLLHVRYGLWWCFVAIALATISFFPSAFDVIGRHYGVHYPPMLAVLIALALMLIKVLAMDIERSQDELKLQRLLQEVAILQSRVQELEGANGPRPVDGDP